MKVRLRQKQWPCLLVKEKDKKNANTFFVDENTFPQTIDVLKTRATPFGIDLEIGNYAELDLTREDLYGVLVQYPSGDGKVIDYRSFVESAHENNVFVTFAADLMALALITPPGEMGADAVVGTTQRFGVPMGYGGPHAAYFATKISLSVRFLVESLGFL